jgi:F-type H+-transporting ATPase subunit a
MNHHSPHWPTELFGTTLHLNTVIMVASAMLALLLFSWIVKQRLSLVPSKLQLCAEGMYDLCRSITLSTGGPKGDGYLFFIGSLFLFILICNWMGQLPLRLFTLPQGELIAATGDFNVPAALAVIAVIMYFAVGIKRKGLAYFKHYVSPHWAFLPFNLLEDITRPGSLMLRLFINIFVGETLALIALKYAPFLAPSAVILMELFVGLVQAYVFALLSAVYIGILSEDHDH